MFVGTCVVRYALLQKPALVTVAKDGIVEVQLDSNPTTGYTWTLASGSKGLEQTGSKYVAKSADGMVGGGGIQTYTFKATGDGENDLEFVYKVRETQPLASSQIRLLIFIMFACAQTLCWTCPRVHIPNFSNICLYVRREANNTVSLYAYKRARVLTMR